MRKGLLLFCLAAFGAGSILADVPRTVDETWADFDPRAEPLEAEVIREEITDGVVLRYVRFRVGTFEGRDTRVAAFYAFPEGGADLPGIVQVHGGGQFARKALVQYHASRGYAAVAVNWGEKPIDQPDDPNSEWDGIPAGFLDPTHHNGVEPAEGTLHEVAHPWNSAWLLYAAAARRAITFLEEQPECDGERIGLHGHSMGGRITVLASIDPRLKAASPSVGGTGNLYEDLRGLPGSARRMPEGPERELYLATIDASHYWPKIQCPVLFLTSTNDFNAPLDLAARAVEPMLRAGKAQWSVTPHLNHRFTADNYAARIRWFDAHLKGNFTFPETPDGGWSVQEPDGIPRFILSPNETAGHEIVDVAIFYGVDRDPRVRFWRSAEWEKQRNGNWVAKCPVPDPGEPIFLFANVTYETGEAIDLPPGYEATSLLTLTSDYCFGYPAGDPEGKVNPSGERQRLIDDFAAGWRDWGVIAGNNRHHWHFETHKINDPDWVGPEGGSLGIEVETTEPGNTLAVVVVTDQWRSYTGRKPQRYVALVELPEAGMNRVELPLERFRTEEGVALTTWDYATSLALTSGWKERPDEVKEQWKGDIPAFGSLRWVGGEFAERANPYLPADAPADAEALFRAQFDQGVSESVDREKVDEQEDP